MRLYVAARILHICGALGMFMALGVDLAGITSLSCARTTEHVRRTIEGYRVNGVLGPASLLLILVPGIYMATTVWAWQPWLQVSFGALLLIVVIGGAVTRRKLGALTASLQGDDRDLTLDQERQIRDPLLRTSFVLRAVLSLGIVVLMSTKPDLSTSLLVIGGALALAAIVSTPFWLVAQHAQQRT
jgi:hypothetical protein